MKSISPHLLCELHILRNRLESGESVLQCLSTMGIPLEGHVDFLTQWKHLSRRIIEGSLSPARAIAEFVSQLEELQSLTKLVHQKTLSARLQAYISAGIVLLLVVAASWIYPENLKPSPFIVFLSTALSVLSILSMHWILRQFLKKAIFLDWIRFLNSIALALECGTTLPTAMKENLPDPARLEAWPLSLREKLRHEFLEEIAHSTTSTSGSPDRIAKNSPWFLAERVWGSVCQNHREGLPQVVYLKKMLRLQSDEFRHHIAESSERSSYLLLLPLFLLSVPAVLILLFAPLLSAL